MAYIKYKEITKYFYFSKLVDSDKVPEYVKDYVFEDEKILSVYKTKSDHGAFTTSKMVLFDLGSSLGISKQIYTIPYVSISSASIIFKHHSADLVMVLDSGSPLHLKFVDMSGIDKARLRLIYSCIIRVMNNQKLDQEVIRKLTENDIHFN